MPRVVPGISKGMFPLNLPGTQKLGNPNLLGLCVKEVAAGNEGIFE